MFWPETFGSSFGYPSSVSRLKMWPDSILLRQLALRSAKYGPMLTPNRNAHYQIMPSGERVVVSKQHLIRNKREKWQNVPFMGKEPELRKLNLIEKDDRLHSDPLMAKVTSEGKLAQLRDRLKTAGFCREVKPYDPPKDVNERIDKLCNEVFPSEVNKNVSFSDSRLKFKFLTKCIQEFDHEVPNCDLFRVNSLEDVIEFYQTPVRGKNNYDHMVQNSSNLPKNLHLIAEPIRFNPQTDIFFNGVSAFPGRRNELVGLRAKKLYPTHNDNFVWPDV